MTRASGHTSVMASRERALDSLDYFPTPPWAARAGGELIKRLDPVAKTCWEPACGGGHMAAGLEGYFDEVGYSDVHQYPGMPDDCVRDFLDPDMEVADWDWIVTNPPFVRGEAFVRRAWARATRGVAMLLRLSFLEGGARHKLLYEDCPLTVCAPFSERVPMVKGRWDPAASSATAYAWFVWVKPEVGVIRAPVLWPIPPGTKARLTRPDDAARFGVEADAPLLDAAG